MLFSKLPVPLKAYIAAHLLLLPVVLAAASRTASWLPGSPALAVSLVAAAVVAGTWKFRLPAIPGMQSLVFAVVSLALMVDGTLTAVLCAALGGLVTHLVRPREQWWQLERKREPVYRHVFNVSHCALVCGIAGLGWDSARSLVPAGPAGVLCRLALFTLIYFMLNSGGIATAVALDRKTSPLQVWRENCLWTAPGYFAAAAASGLLWLAYRAAGPGALVLLPAYFVIYRGYAAYIGALQHAQAMTRKVQALYEREELANRRKDEFLAMLAHELRNPLAAIGNAQYVLAQPGISGERETRNLEIIGRQTRHLKRLVDDLLDVSRITRGVVELRQEVVDLAEVLRSALTAVEPLSTLRRHSISVQVPEGPVTARADPARIEQVFSNILSNAVKYTEPGGKIEARLEVSGSEAVLHVRDTGIGIAPDLLPHVFDLFVQADRSLARSHGGLGIGLTLVRSLVEMHGGRVTAESAGLGKGSEFSVRLPLAGQEEPAPAAGRAASTLQRGATVVVVEDNVDAAETLAEMLDLWGYRPLIASTGPAGLALVRKAEADVVLLDIGLPEMDGYEVARRLREEVGAGMPLIALTGYGRPEDRDTAQAAGFDHQLVKPVNPDELRRVLGRVVGGGAVSC